MRVVAAWLATTVVVVAIMLVSPARMADDPARGRSTACSSGMLYRFGGGSGSARRLSVVFRADAT